MNIHFHENPAPGQTPELTAVIDSCNKLWENYEAIKSEQKQRLGDLSKGVYGDISDLAERVNVQEGRVDSLGATCEALIDRRESLERVLADLTRRVELLERG